MLTIRQPDRKESQDDWLGPAPWIIVPPPGPQAIAAVARDERVTSPSYARPYPLVVRRARGSIVEDLDGNRYLDFSAGVAVCNTGHCHPVVVKSIEQQAQDLLHMCGSDFYYEPMIRLAEKLSQITPGSFEKRVLFTDSGTEAIDASIRLARYCTQRKHIIGFCGEFHYQATGSLSPASSTCRRTEPYDPPVPGVTYLPYGDLDAVEKLLEHQVPGEEIAAIVVEPILDEGGCVVPPPEFLPGLHALCDRHHILLIVNETRSGMGRTGKVFACEHFRIAPDILCLAEGIASGMPLGAVVAAQSIMSSSKDARGGRFGGSPVSCAAALATIELIENHYRANATLLGPLALNKLDALAGKYKCIGEVRGIGLMIAFDVVHSRKKTPDPELRDRILGEAFVRGLLLLGCGESAVRICPPLCINRTQLEVGLDVLDEVIATVAD